MQRLGIKAKFLLSSCSIAFIGMMITGFLTYHGTSLLILNLIEQGLTARLESLEAAVQTSFEENLERQKELSERIFKRVGSQLQVNASHSVEMDLENQETHVRTRSQVARVFWNNAPLHQDDLVDRLEAESGSAVTLFSLNSEGFVRVSTSLKKSDGTRAVGTYLPPSSPVYQKLMSGDPFLGRAKVLGQWFVTSYHPIIQSGKTVGAFFVGTKERFTAKISSYLKTQKLLKSGYFFIVDSTGTLVMHPTREGENILNLKDAAGKQIIQEIIKNRNGTLDYGLESPGTGKIQRKIAVYHYFPLVDWYAAASLNAEEAWENLTNLKKIIFFTTLMVLVVMVLTVSLAASKISKVLQNVTESLKKQSRAVQDQAGSVLKNSEQLASASNQQAAALQETTSTLEQIEATVQKNLETTQTSEGLSLKSKEASVRGVMAMGRLNQAMSSVNATQQSSEQQMKQSFVGLRQLSSVMEMIQKKTEVIHEIVSQTKILSFNASVESARAGEQGKGFAIVAEEVGRLAHMTGGAAEEIHSTVSKSVQQVEELLTQAEKDLGNSFQVSHTTVQSTAEIVRESELILQEIQQNAQRTYEAVSGITVTSREQVKAIHEASKVIHEIDIATQETAKISQETQTIAQNLAAQSASLKESTNVLEILVQGKLNESLESLI